MSIISGTGPVFPFNQSSSGGSETQETSASSADTSDSQTTGSTTQSVSSSESGTASQSAIPTNTGDAAQLTNTALIAAPSESSASLAAAATLDHASAQPDQETGVEAASTATETRAETEIALARAAADAYRSQQMLTSVLEGMSSVYQQVSSDNPDEIAVPWVDNLPDKPI